MLDQFDRLRKRNAFLEQYKKERLFENGLEEFDESRSVSKGFYLDVADYHLQSYGGRALERVQSLRKPGLYQLRPFSTSLYHA